MDFDLNSISSSVDMFFDDKPKNRIASSGKVRISGVSDLVGFSVVAGTDNLIRVSQADFWRLAEDEEGHFIERLVDDGQGPVQG